MSLNTNQNVQVRVDNDLPTEKTDRLSMILEMLKHRRVKVTYTNWKGDTRERYLRPKFLWFGCTQWHQEPQYLLSAVDEEDNRGKDFAVADFHPDFTHLDNPEPTRSSPQKD